MTNQKPKIPVTAADQALYLSEKCCCVCHNPAVGVQVHHIDGDPSNDDLENLAVLCTHHHDEATREGGLTRKLSSGLVLLYREEWRTIVQARRERERMEPVEKTGSDKQRRRAWGSTPVRTKGGQSTGRTGREAMAKLLLDSLAIHEIRKIHFEFERDPLDRVQALRLMELLRFYAERYHTPVGENILSALSAPIGIHFGMDAFVASHISLVIEAVLPVASLVGPEWRRRTAAEVRLLRSGTSRGFELAYNGVKWLRDLGVVDAGSNILWTVLRHATLNRNRYLAREVVDYFQRLEQYATERGFPDAARWLAYRRADALDVAQKGPRPPDDLEERIWGAREEAKRRLPAALSPGSG